MINGEINNPIKKTIHESQRYPASRTFHAIHAAKKIYKNANIYIMIAPIMSKRDEAVSIINSTFFIVTFMIKFLLEFLFVTNLRKLHRLCKYS